MKLTQELRCVISITFVTSSRRGITGGWAGWVDAHLGFGRIEGATRQRWRVELLIAHPVLGNHLQPCHGINSALLEFHKAGDFGDFLPQSSWQVLET